MARQTPLKPRAPHLLALEPRVMFDAAAPAALRTALAHKAETHGFDRATRLAPDDRQDGAGDPRAAELQAFNDSVRPVERARPSAPLTVTPRTEPAQVADPAPDASHQIIAIDTSLADYQQLARDWARLGEVVLIDKDQDGLAQIQAAVAGRSDLTAIHIVTHGEEGDLLIGSTKLDEAAIAGAAQELAAIGRALAPGGDILVYGCDFAQGADGALALGSLAKATGADVAASTDLTGYAPLGGDWILEARQGDIQAHALSDTAYQHTLTPGPVTAVPISTVVDSLTVTNGSGAVVASGASNGYTNGYSPGVGAGATARWTGAAVQNGQSYDLVATVVSISTNDFVQFLHPTGRVNSDRTSDDATFLLTDNSGTNNSTGDGASVQLAWQLVLTGTNTPAPADVTFNVLDIDGVGGNANSRETVTAKANELYYYTHESVSDIVFDYNSANNTVTASGTRDENPNYPSDPTIGTPSEASFSYKNTSGFTLTYALAAANGAARQARFFQDGNSDFLYTTPVYGSIPHLDLDGDDSTAAGADAHFVFTEKNGPVPVVDTDVLVTNPEAVNSIASGSVTLTNAQAGDVLHVGTLPSNITATTSTANGMITVSLSGLGSETDYQAAYRAITFENTSAAPDTTQRVLSVAFTNDTNYSAAANSRIDVVAVDDPPVNTLPASFTTGEDVPLQLTGLAVSDPDSGAGALSVTLSVPTGTLAASSGGGVTVVGSDSGSLVLTGTQDALNGYLASASAPTFTGAHDASGDVTLTLATSDNGATGNGGPLADTDTSTITVTPVNDAPVNTLPTGYTAAEDSGPLALTGVSISDVDAGAGLETLTLSVPTGAGSLAATSAGGVTAAGSGGASLTLTGTLSDLNGYLADASTRPTFTSAPNYNGTVTLEMVTSDNGHTGSGGAKTDTDTSSLAITPVNDPPTAIGTLPNQSAQDAQSVRYTTAGGFADVDGDTLTYSASGLPAGLAIDPDSGVISGVLDRSASQPNGGAYAVVVRATDPSGTSGTQSFALAVTNPAPTARDDGASTRTGSPVAIAVLANDTDLDGDPLTVTGAGVGAGAPGHGAVAVNADGTITYTPDAGFGGTDSFTYAISDGQGGTSSARVTVTVAPDGAPTARPDQAATAPGAPVIVSVLANDSDPDGDPLSVTGASAAHGTVALEPDGTLTYTPNVGFTGVDAVTYAISDGRGGTASSTLSVTVQAAPDTAPRARPDQASTAVGAPVKVCVLANDTDADGDPLTVTDVGAPLHGAVTRNADGTITYTPDAGFTGADAFTYAISDGRGGSATATVDVTVGAAPNAPPLPRPDRASTSVGTPVTVAVLANDSDPDGDPLTVTAVGAPGHGAVALNPDGMLTYKPDVGFSGADSFTYGIADGRGGTATSTVSVTVHAAPVARPDQATTSPGAPVTVAVLANDSAADGASLSVTNAAATHGTVVVNPDGTLTYTPSAGFLGTDTITYSVSDGLGGAATSTASVRVEGPFVARPDQATTAPGQAVTVAVLANDTSPDGAGLSVTSASARHGTVAINPDGTLTYIPDRGYVGPDTITYAVTDAQGDVAQSSATVQVGRPTADVEQLLHFGQVVFPGAGPDPLQEPTPETAVDLALSVPGDLARSRSAQAAGDEANGAGAVSAPSTGLSAPDDGLSVHDALARIRSLNDTAISQPAVDGAVNAARRLYGTSIDDAAPIAGEVARLDDYARVRDAGDRAFDPRWSDFAPKPLTGFSRAAPGDGAVMFDSVVRGGAIYLDVQDTATDGRAPTSSFAVHPTGGGPLAAWIRVDPRGLAIIERPADVDELHLTLDVTRQDGRTIRTPVVIQGATGEIELARPLGQIASPAEPPRHGHGHHHRESARHAPLDRTLSTLQARRRHEADALSKSFR